MTRILLSAALLLIAMTITLYALVSFHLAANSAPRSATPIAHPVFSPIPHAGNDASACPAYPHGVSPRPTLPAKAVIRT